MDLALPRRSFLAGILAMPAIVQADRLMRISAPRGLIGPDWRDYVGGANIDLRPGAVNFAPPSVEWSADYGATWHSDAALLTIVRLFRPHITLTAAAPPLEA